MPFHDARSEREEIDGVLRGDPGAFDAFVDRYWRFIRAIVLRVGGGRLSMIEEIPQAVILRLMQDDFRLLRQWRGDGAFAHWLGRVVRTTSVDYMRERYRVPLDPFPDEGDESGETWDPPDADRGAEVALIEEERRRELVRLLGGLSEADRRLVQRKFLDGASNESLARELGIELNTLHQRLHRALRRLARLAGEGPATPVRRSGSNPSGG